MKYSEIPQFTRSPTYTVNSSWDYFINDWLERAKEHYGLELNPDFQRGHVWTYEQQIAYVEFVLRGGTSGRNIYFNHPGWMGSYKGSMVCVDGLQRITTAQGFMNNTVPAFGLYRKDFEGRLPMDVQFVVHVNDLKTRKEVIQWYLEMNGGGTPHTKEELDRVKKLLTE